MITKRRPSENSAITKAPNDVTLSQINTKTLEQLPVAVILFDLGKIHFANSFAKKQFKITDSGKSSFFDLVQKKESAELKSALKSLINGKSWKKKAVSLLNNKKKYCTYFIEANLISINGRPVVQGIFSEATELATGPSDTDIDLLQIISENSHDVIFHFGFTPRMKLKFISDSSKNVLGYSPKEIYENPEIISTHLHEEDRHLLVISPNDYLAQSKQERKRRIVVRFKYKGGAYRNLEITVNPVHNQKKQLVGLIGNMRDITERIETGELLLETKNKFDLITNNSNDIICFYSYYPEEKYLYVSPNIKKILGYEVKDLMNNKNFLSDKLVTGWEEFAKAEKLLLNYQKKNLVKNYHFSFKMLNRKNEELWIENNLVPITDASGKITFFINILRDITEQKETDIEIEIQYNNYRNLLDTSPIAYIIHDHGVCQYVNNALLKLFKLKSKSHILGKFVLDFFDEPDRKRALERIRDIYEHGIRKSKFTNYSITDLEGGKMEVEIKSVPIKFNNRDCILALVNNLSEIRQREKEKVKALITETANKQLQKEIKERQDAERNLMEKTAHLSSIFESSTHLIWTVNNKYLVTSFNQNFASVVKIQHGVEIKPGYKIDEHLLRNREQYVNFWYTKYAEAFKGKKLEFVKEDFNERPLYRKIFINPIFNNKGEITEISCIANDITDSKIYEQKLINQTGKLSAIFDSSHHYIWTIDREEKLTSFNKNYYDLVTTLYNTKPFLGLVLNRGVLANDKEYTELLQFHYDKAFAGLATSFEIETRDKELKNVYLEIYLNPIMENGKVVEVSGIAHNITEKKHVQQRMEQSLKEKEVLLREVHHRVKNNMQVISSILNLQSSYVSDEYTLSLLKESQNRIKTMAYIHESLYQNKSFTSVNFSDYVHTLVNNIVQSYSYNTEKIKLNLNIEKVTLSLDSSIPAGLIINELITNAIKHAFPGDKQGVIHFSLRTENNYVFLELKDNGVGFASGIDFENSHSLGLQLVNTLIEQIEGKLKFKSEQGRGTEVFLTFKM